MLNANLERFLKRYYDPVKLTPFIVMRHRQDLQKYGEDIIPKELAQNGVGVRFNESLEVLSMKVPSNFQITKRGKHND